MLEHFYPTTQTWIFVLAIMHPLQIPNKFSRVLVGIISWFSQEDLLGLIKASKEENNLIPPPKDLGVFLTILEVEGVRLSDVALNTRVKSSKVCTGNSRIQRFKKHQIQGVLEV